MTNNGREVLRVSPANNLRERAFQIFGGGLLESLLPVEGGREYVARVTGFVSAPRERRTTRDGQYFFVNNRFVRDKTIAGGLLEGYRSVLPHGVYPVAFLFLELPLEEIDVNVHPAKTEIRFRRGEAVKNVIAEASRNALAKAGKAGGAGNFCEKREMVGGRWTKFERKEHGVGQRKQEKVEHPKPEQSNIAFEPSVIIDEPLHFEERSCSATALSETAPPLSFEGDATQPIENAPQEIPFSFETLASELSTTGIASYAELPPVNSADKLTKSIEVEQISSAKIQPLGQLHESFIIAVDDEGLLLIDQHVAHERILFDKYRKSETDRPIESQNLLLPETIDLSPAQSEAFQLIENDLETLGFGVMKLSGRTIAIKSIPTDLPASEARNLFAEILDTIENENKGSPKSTLRDDIARSPASKAAGRTK